MHTGLWVHRCIHIRLKNSYCQWHIIIETSKACSLLTNFFTQFKYIRISDKNTNYIIKQNKMLLNVKKKRMLTNLLLRAIMGMSKPDRLLKSA